MDRAMVLEHLEMAHRHVSDGERHVARQRALIAELDRDGHDSWRARLLLQQFEDMLRLHVQERDRLEKMAAEPS
jgi:hypothetical protein